MFDDITFYNISDYAYNLIKGWFDEDDCCELYSASLMEVIYPGPQRQNRI